MMMPSIPPLQTTQDPTPFHIAAASIHSFLAKKVAITLLDDQKIIGKLESFDDFGNLTLAGAVERKIVCDLYCDIPIGLFVTRDENLTRIEEMDSQTAAELPMQMIRASFDEIQMAERSVRDSLHTVPAPGAGDLGAGLGPPKK